MTIVRSDHRDLRKDHDDLAKSLPDQYARRDDVKEGFDRMYDQHRELNQKLDRLLSRQ